MHSCALCMNSLRKLKNRKLQKQSFSLALGTVRDKVFNINHIANNVPNLCIAFQVWKTQTKFRTPIYTPSVFCETDQNVVHECLYKAYSLSNSSERTGLDFKMSITEQTKILDFVVYNI